MKTTILNFLFLLIWTTGFAQFNKNFIDQPYIEVTGKAEMEVVPNEIYLEIHIMEADYSNRTTLEKLEKSMIENLDALSIDTKNDLSIIEFSSAFKEHLLRKNSIQTSKKYQLKVYDGPTTARVMLSLEKIGISKIQVTQVGHSEMDQLQLQVKIEAIQAAKKKAEMLAQGIDQDIGNALHIQEIGNGYFPRVQRAGNVMMKAVAESADAAFIPEIEFEKIKLEYSIMVKFELKTKG